MTNTYGFVFQVDGHDVAAVELPGEIYYAVRGRALYVDRHFDFVALVVYRIVL